MLLPTTVAFHTVAIEVIIRLKLNKGISCKNQASIRLLLTRAE